MTDINWQGEDGEPGYPGLQGPPGAKVGYLINYYINFCFSSFSCMNIEFWTSLKQGEPGMGEKGERGMDGRPGIKVHKSVITRYL